MNAEDILKELFKHITKPSEGWPTTTVGKRVDDKGVWYVGGVDDEFRDYLVGVEKFLNGIHK